MGLTANKGMCTYCSTSPSTTLDHEEPIADNGADVWWNFLPACKPCNDWKRKRTALEWLIDQKLHRAQPTVGFDTRRMPLIMFHGFEARIERVHRELSETGRRDWFRHHYGEARHKNKAEMLDQLDSCRKELSGYPHLPWTTPNVRATAADVCTRHICCGWRHPHARYMEAVILTDDQFAAFSRSAFENRMSEGDLTAMLILRHLNALTNGGARSTSAASDGAAVPGQRRY
ncbi:HNH endonuclease signature motif containing protein [Streptomyces sp. BPTC-684]|uniref:HNH endonuclease n=1 Tax=Streptomyces sp. BPTC-684 TaxID=3043734 RepID=UPI0024B090E6|nr:HNH endonuclease signature motif containing protein [Streptomyces sp. BPTC-684]WHM38250.1 HNH endonuclease signature motif containing protein [Streptomyces sp. BPTC-684]